MKLTRLLGTAFLDAALQEELDELDDDFDAGVEGAAAARRLMERVASLRPNADGDIAESIGFRTIRFVGKQGLEFFTGFLAQAQDP